VAQQRRRSRRAIVAGLTWRGDVAYYQRSHQRLPKGRVYRSLDTKDREQAVVRAGALNTLVDRGDWDVLARWAGGEIEITDLVRAVREGEYRKLRLLHREGIKLGAAGDAYLARVEATLGESTARKYRRIVGAAIKELGAGKRLHEVSTADAEAYLHAPSTRTKQPLAAHTQASMRNTLGALWRFAMEREQEEAERVGATPSLTSNPWRKAKAPRIRRTRLSYLTHSEGRDLLAHSAVAGTPVAALLATSMFGGGLRLSELRYLRTDVDIVLTNDPATSWIIVQSRDGEFAWRPKTENGERRLRTVPLLHSLLVNHRGKFAGQRFFFKPESGDTPPDRSTVRRWVKAAFEAAGIRYGRSGDALTHHSLRHTYVTWLLTGGVPLPTAARRAGDSPQVLLKTYAHVMPESDELADQVLQRIATNQAEPRNEQVPD
jgi:integrase